MTLDPEFASTAITTNMFLLFGVGVFVFSLFLGDIYKWKTVKLVALLIMSVCVMVNVYTVDTLLNDYTHFLDRTAFRLVKVGLMLGLATSIGGIWYVAYRLIRNSYNYSILKFQETRGPIED